PSASGGDSLPSLARRACMPQPPGSREIRSRATRIEGNRQRSIRRCEASDYEEGSVRTVVLFAALGVLLCAIANAQERPRERAVPVIQQWNGGSVEKKDENAWKVAPATGVISDAEVWSAVWKAWNGDRVGVPAVDFGKEVVLVAAAGGQNDFTVA